MLVFGGVECFTYHFNKSEIGLSSTAKFDNVWPAWHVEDHENCFCVVRIERKISYDHMYSYEFICGMCLDQLSYSTSNFILRSSTCTVPSSKEKHGTVLTGQLFTGLV